MQAPEDTKAKVQKRAVPPTPHAGGRALHAARTTQKNPSINTANIPRLTPKPQPNTANMPRLAPRPQTITQRPHVEDRHDYSRSGGRALNAARSTPEHKQHNELVKIARTVLQAHANTPQQGVTGDTKSDLEHYTADAFKVKSPQYQSDLEAAAKAGGDYITEKAKEAKQAENDKYSGNPFSLAQGFITGKGPIATQVLPGIENAVGKAAPYVAAAAVPALAATAKAVGAWPEAKKVIGNAGKDLVNIPANAIPSIYNVAEPAVSGAVTQATNPNSGAAKAGLQESIYRITEPYVNLAKHPAKSFEEHPLASGLMLYGGAKSLDRVAGRVEQQAVPMMKPRKPYEPIEIKLPGTAAKTIVLPRQGAIANRLQTRNIKNVARMSDREINTRIDHTFYTGQNQSRAEAYEAQHAAKAANPKITDKQLQEVGEQAKAQSREFWRDESVKDMALRDKNGRLKTYHFIDGKGGASQAITRWGQNMINQGREATMQTYEHGTGKKVYKGARGTGVQTLVPREIKTGAHKGKFVLIPKMAADRLDAHDSYIKQTVGSAIGQAVGGTFRRTVLPFSPKWLANNYSESGLRGAVNGVGPLSMKEGQELFQDLGPQQKAEFNQLVKSVGHGGMQRRLLDESSTWEDRLAHTAYENMGKAITKYGQKPIPKNLNNLYAKYTDLVFNHLNGHAENAMHTAMAGKVLRRNPLMSEKLRTLTQKAMKDADGPATVEARNNIIALARETDRMFGKYGKFSPDTRRYIATWMPFIPWTLNAVHFITQHLPADHPAVTSLLASAHVASQEWEKKHGLGYFMNGSLPPFLQGSIPGGNGSHWLIFNQGTPFSAAGDPTGTLANNFNPLGSTIQANLQGFDWKGNKLKNDNPGTRVLTAFLSMVEGTTPMGYAANRITGGNDGAGANLAKWANPYHSVKGGKKPGNGRHKKAPGLFSGGGNGPSLFHGSRSGTPSLFGP